MKEIAIIGPTASGKSDLAIDLALQFNANILSLDSLSIYKEIDIVSAKPSKEELQKVKHFGIDEIYPHEVFNAQKYIEIYKKAKKEAQNLKKNLIIVGGTSFYLKALLEGLSTLPSFSQQTVKKVSKLMQERAIAYEMVKKIDPLFAQKITKHDRYRIEKALLIFYETSLSPTSYFKKNRPKPICSPIIYEIAVAKEVLIQRIEIRTKKMIQKGLIDEILSLEKRYSRAIQPMKAIGVKETLQYLDGKIKDIKELEEKISKNTKGLAKRQITFNRTQFKEKKTASLKELKQMIEKELAD